PQSPTLFPYTTLFRSLVLGGREIRHAGATPRRHQEVAVERDGALLRRPLRQALQLGTIALGRRGLDDEIEPLRATKGNRAELERSEEHTSELQSRFDL